MRAPKTKLTTASVDAFLDKIRSEQVRDDCRTIAGMMQDATRAKPELWGPSIVGFGRRKVRYADGRQAEFMAIAFAPRKTNITLYLMSGFTDRERLLDQLGQHSCGQGCVYIKRLSDVHLPTLKKLIVASVKHARANNAPG
jgi:hypothetical protein